MKHYAPWMAVAIVLAGCRAEVTAEANRTTARIPLPAATVGVDPGIHGHEVGRSTLSAYTVQSRSVLTLALAPALAEAAQLAVVNQKTGARLGVTPTTTLSLSLLDPTNAPLFATGANELWLVSSDADGAVRHYATAAVKLVDVPVFGFTSGSFAAGTQTAGGFQGGFEPLGPGIATGFVPLVNW